jgi:hypothetical protein
MGLISEKSVMKIAELFLDDDLILQINQYVGDYLRDYPCDAGEKKHVIIIGEEQNRAMVLVVSILEDNSNGRVKQQIEVKDFIFMLLSRGKEWVKNKK